MKKTKLQIAWTKRLKLHAEGDKLCAECNILWATAVIKVYGNVVIEWTSTGCKVEGVEYKDAG